MTNKQYLEPNHLVRYHYFCEVNQCLGACCGGCFVSSLLSYQSVYCDFNTNFFARENV